MPDWVKNVVWMQGIAKLPLYTKGEDGREVFDFNKLIEMPESLEVISGPVEDLAVESALTLIQRAQEKKSPSLKIEFRSSFHEPLKDALRRQNATIEEMGRLGLKYLENMILYGASTWYEWCIDNWGTKWNAVDSYLEDDDTLTFKTAQSDPMPVILRLHEMFPDSQIMHVWAGEDVGKNTGRRWFGDGDAVEEEYESCSQEALDAYIECWGESNCVYTGEDSLLYKHSCEDCDGCD